jgi:lipopolysaccharide export system protein LptA
VAFATAGVAAAPAPAQQAAGQRKQQQPSGPPNALQGFSQNRDKPVKINAAELEVHDKDKLAVFSGDVHLVQGDTDMRTRRLIVYYDDQPPPPAKSAKAGTATAEMTAQQNQQIKRVEARGSVIVVQKQKDQKDQTATGDEGIFDMRANTVTMVGNVVISQGESILRGDNLTVNMTTGDALLTCGKDKERCRVLGLFNPSSMKQEGLPLGRKP